MTTASEIVRQAYREGNLIGAKATLTSEQISEGLALLNEFLDSLFGFELGEFSMDWPVPPSTTSPVLADFPLYPRSKQLPSDVWPYPPGNVRLLLNLVADTTVYLPQSPQDGARIALVNVGDASSSDLTIDANGRLVEGLSTLTDTPGNLAGKVLFYDAKFANWKLISILAETDESPFQIAYDTFLAIGTLKRLAGRVGRSIKPEQFDTFKRLERRMKSQFRQASSRPSAVGNPFSTPASDKSGRGYSLGGTLY